MKKFYDCKFVAMMLLLSLLSFSLSSCSSDDDDDNGDGSNQSSIIGKWMSENSDYTFACIIFYENGTGKWSDNKVPDSFSNFEYRYDKENASIQCHETDYPTSTWEILEIINLTETRLVIAWEDGYGDTETMVFRKETNNGGTNSTQNYQTLIVGQWLLHVDPQGATDKKTVVTFASNGTYQATDYTGWYIGNSLGDLLGTYNGTYFILNNTISITGQSQIAGEYIIDSLVENGMRLILKSDPQSYPYLVGGWY